MTFSEEVTVVSAAGQVDNMIPLHIFRVFPTELWLSYTSKKSYPSSRSSRVNRRTILEPSGTRMSHAQ